MRCNSCKLEDTAAAVLAKVLLLPDVPHRHVAASPFCKPSRINVDKVAQSKREVNWSCWQRAQCAGDYEHRNCTVCLRLRPHLVAFACVVFVLVGKATRVTCSSCTVQ